MADGPNPADGVSTLDDVDIGEQFLIQRLLDEMKLDEDFKVIIA